MTLTQLTAALMPRTPPLLIPGKSPAIQKTGRIQATYTKCFIAAAGRSFGEELPSCVPEVVQGQRMRGALGARILRR